MKRIFQIAALLAFLAVAILTAFPPRVNFFYASPDGTVITRFSTDNHAAGYQYTSPNGQNFYAMFAWDAGGIDTDGAFMCAGAGHIDQTTGAWVQDWSNPLAPLFPSLIVDC